MASASVYLALGANLGDRSGALREATRRLGERVRIIARSPVYETDAVADEPQPAYLNAVLRVETDLPPRAVLDLCLEVERAMGRARPHGRSKAPRTIDVDLLLHGAARADEPGLSLPHPGLRDRAFVRIPLADVAEPGLCHPTTGEPLDRALPNPTVRRAGDP